MQYGKQILLVTVAVVVGVLIFVKGKRTTLSTTAIEASVPVTANLDDVVDSYLQMLSEADAEKLNDLKSQLAAASTDKERNLILLQLTIFLDQKSLFAPSGYYYSMLANLDTNNANLWASAGLRLTSALDMETDSTFRAILGQKSIEWLIKASVADPANADIKADLAQAYVLGSDKPMQGIQMLRELVEKDPAHLKSNLYLAQLSIKSGQYEKAIERFLEINRLYPNYAEAYLGLGEAYYQMKNVKQAIIALEQYKGIQKDPNIVAQIDQFIQEIKSSVNN